MNAKTINNKLWVSRCMPTDGMNGWMGVYIVGRCRHSSIHEGEKGGKNIQTEKIERTDTQTHEKIMNKSANNQFISH